jgi:hypothetical protein
MAVSGVHDALYLHWLPHTIRRDRSADKPFPQLSDRVFRDVRGTQTLAIQEIISVTIVANVSPPSYLIKYYIQTTKRRSEKKALSETGITKMPYITSLLTYICNV